MLQSFKKERFGWLCDVLVLFLIAMIPACASNNVATGLQNAEKEFNERVEKYLQLQRKAVASVPSIPENVNDPALIVKREQQIADTIRAMRPNAAPGDIFIPPIRQMIVDTIKRKLEGKEGEAARSVVLGEGNPKSPESATPVKLAVNTSYPTAAPLSTVPPSLLMALPALPETLEFRFVGRSLILRDAKANLIVDILPDAFSAK